MSQAAKKAKVVHNFFKPKNSNDIVNKIKWSYHETILVGQYKVSDNNSNENGILGLDLDNTLIKVNGKHVHPKDEYDWSFWHKDAANLIKDRLNGRTLVIFSNQNGLCKIKNNGNTLNESTFKKKLGFIVHQLDLPLYIFAATGKDRNRKPCIGMWEYLEKLLEIKIDKSKTLYVGDAAGRPANFKPKHKKDFSDSDRKFALNFGVSFQTPEEFFLNETPAPFSLSGFNPNEFLKKQEEKSVPTFSKNHELEVLILVGLPGAGKSYLFDQNLKHFGYTRVNMDTLKTKKKCIEFCEKSLKNKISVVIDNTNMDKASRKVYIDIAKAHQAKVRCIHLNVDFELAYHNNLFRSYYPLLSDKDEPPREQVSKIVYFSMQKKYQPPQQDEGFEDIIIIPFKLNLDRLDPLVRNHYKKYWNMFLS